jgi:hypothetical protein
MTLWRLQNKLIRDAYLTALARAGRARAEAADGQTYSQNPPFGGFLR